MLQKLIKLQSRSNFIPNPIFRTQFTLIPSNPYCLLPLALPHFKEDRFMINNLDQFTQHLLPFSDVATTLLLNGAWALASLLWVEVVRDGFHILAHHWSWLARHHSWHHRVFYRDMSAVSPELYQQSQWHHDVPEAGVMLISAMLFYTIAFHWTVATGALLGSLLGIFYTLRSLFIAVCRGLGYPWAIAVDANHQSGVSPVPPSKWIVNWSYHQRHHFENLKAYFSGVFTLVDKFLGTALSLKGKTIAVTGASGALGQAFLKHLHQANAKVIALSSSQTDPMIIEINGQSQTIETIIWTVGEEAALGKILEKIDILVLNHGVNQRERTEAAALNSFEINTLSAYRIMERFLAKVQTPFDAVRKEIWVITSEAEVAPAHSPLYEMSKRALGNLVTLKRLDAPCVLRKVVLGGFRSRMSPKGRLSADWMAQQVVKAAQRDTRNIIISYRFWIYLYYPLKEWLTARYYRRFSQETALSKTEI